MIPPLPTPPAFFIPHAGSPAEAESILRMLARRTGYAVPAPHIYALEYEEDGRILQAIVGAFPDPYYQVREPILAILEGAGVYALCLPSHGGVGGSPLFVGYHAVRRTLAFDNRRSPVAAAPTAAAAPSAPASPSAAASGIAAAPCSPGETLSSAAKRRLNPRPAQAGKENS